MLQLNAEVSQSVVGSDMKHGIGLDQSDTDTGQIVDKKTTTRSEEPSVQNKLSMFCMSEVI